MVEHFLGKEEVSGPTPDLGSTKVPAKKQGFLFFMLFLRTCNTWNLAKFAA